MRALIFGNKGQLGRDLMHVFGQFGDAVGYDLPEVSITDEAAVRERIAHHQADIVINAAAYTDVEGAEDHENDAFAINETGAALVAEAARDAGLPVVHYSTDFVFDGRKTTPYEPDDATNPLSVYGRSKLAGEDAVRNTHSKHFIVRTAWLYGPGGNNFVEKILALARQHASLKVVSEEVGSPTHTWDLAEATLALAQTTAYGTHHAVNAGQTSRDRFAAKILALAGIRTPVEPCASDAFPMKAARPVYSVLSTETLTAACGYRFRTWESALEHYLERRG